MENEGQAARGQEEQRKKQEEYEIKFREYAAKVKLAPVKGMKSWAGSQIVLALAILTSITALFSVISLFTTLSAGWIKIITNLVKLTLNILLCVGFWRIFAMGRKKDAALNSGGARMLKGVLTFYQVITYIVMILAIILFIVAFIGMKTCADKIQVDAGEAGIDLSQANATFTGILIGILVALVAVFVVFIFYYAKTIGFTKAVIFNLDAKSFQYAGSTAAAALFFIVGAVSLLSAISPYIAAGVLSEILGQLPSSMNFLSSLGGLLKGDVANLLAGLAKALTYIFGGVLVLSYNGLITKVTAEIGSLEKPAKPL